MYIDDEELRGLYKTSSSEHIQAIESALMQLEKQPQNTDVLKELLRSAHTLKGDSRMLGVEDVETLVHQIEECLMPIETGQAMMTGELCDRLYTGLDTIQKLAHTAVTGEANDVNLFYVLATLMGDGEAASTQTMLTIPSISAPIPSGDLFGSASTVLGLDGMPVDDSGNLAAAALLFDLPPESDRWIDEEGTLEQLTIADEPESSPIPSQLQANFLALASELFSADSTRPTLDDGAVFNDFTILPGTEPPADLLAAEQETEQRLFPIDDDFTLIPSTIDGEDIDSFTHLRDLQFGDDFETICEDDLFSSFGDELDELVSPGADRLMLASSLEQDISAIPSRKSIVAPLAASPITKDSRSHPATPATTVNDYQIETIRVEAKQLDTLMGQTAEINVIEQQIASRLADLDPLLELWENGSRDYQQLQLLLRQISPQSPIHQHLNRSYQQWEQMGQLIEKFKQAIGSDSARLNLVTSALDSGVSKLRLLPCSTIFNLFPRMVRDLAKTQSKEINFAVEGGDILLDKRLLEEIKDPLMHILRNAIDHGIETPDERQQQGKLPAATLLIQVRQTGNKTTIEIADDGRGLDLKRIKATAVKRGLYTEAELAAMSVDRIHALIFAPGFSTRSRVTELSGRGVGLDIVRTNVERLKGSVAVESMLNRGCTFHIELTHSIGSSQVMMVDVRDRTYAIPVEFVDRMLLLNKAEIFALGGTPTAKINGNTVTVAWLADLLALPPIAPNFPGEVHRTTNTVACLLLQSGQQQLALLVDRIRDRQLVTIESLHPVLKNVPHLSGATILGTGDVCLILNPLDLLTTAAGENPSSSAAVAAEPKILPVDAPPTILLVEDSLVIRTQMQRILGGAGYQVSVAIDGVEGWEKLQTGKFDLVVSDVEMPRCGGLELTNQIRQHSDYQNLPVILVTTLSAAADRDRGFQAGANAYLTKGDFDQQLLLDTLTRLI